MTLPYREGSWFAVPLKRGGYGLGLVARSAADGKVLLGYFFGPRHSLRPSMRDTRGLEPRDAALIVRFGDLSLINGEWPILGESADWDRRSWSSPEFVRSDPLSGRAWRVRYDDRDPSFVVSEVLTSADEPVLRRDGLFGAGAVESVLDRKVR